MWLCIGRGRGRGWFRGQVSGGWVFATVEESGRALRDTPPFRKVRERMGHPIVVVGHRTEASF